MKHLQIQISFDQSIGLAARQDLEVYRFCNRLYLTWTWGQAVQSWPPPDHTKQGKHSGLSAKNGIKSNGM